MSVFSTGLPALDQVLQGIRPGDNVAWQLDELRDFSPFIEAFIGHAIACGERVIYFRFAHSKPPISSARGLEVENLEAIDGFEQFMTRIHRRITQEGKGKHYIFDLVSDLNFGCFSDRMVGNFFKLTAAYLHQMEAVSYFPVLRNHHCYHATQPITETTQILLDVYRVRDRLYVQPQKVAERFSPTLFLLHEWQGDHFTPVKESGHITEVLNSRSWPGLPSASQIPPAKPVA